MTAKSSEQKRGLYSLLSASLYLPAETLLAADRSASCCLMMSDSFPSQSAVKGSGLKDRQRRASRRERKRKKEKHRHSHKDIYGRNSESSLFMPSQVCSSQVKSVQVMSVQVKSLFGFWITFVNKAALGFSLRSPPVDYSLQVTGLLQDASVRKMATKVNHILQTGLGGLLLKCIPLQLQITSSKKYSVT